MKGQTCIIIGGGHAAAQLVFSLRQEGWTGRLQLISNESVLPYHRPPLSKDYMVGNKSFKQLLIRNSDFYHKAEVECLLNQTVITIDSEKKTITLLDGRQLSYHKLIIATGARARQLKVPGAELEGIFSLRTIADSQRIAPYIKPRANAVIVGGGYIGLEVAAMLTKTGVQVTVLESADRVLERVTSPQLSSFYQRVYFEKGVKLITGIKIDKFLGDQHVTGVRVIGGKEYTTDFILVGIGAEPNTRLAETTGLNVKNGIVVNQHTMTSDPDIAACGDCCRFPCAIYDRDLRLESVQNAADQARVAAASICGKDKVYRSVPWFWSDQFDLKLQIVGLSQAYDEVIFRGDIQHGNSFAAFYFSGDRLLAADCVNRPREFILAKQLLERGGQLNKEKITDESLSAKELMV
ncbi:MAG: FAD-dependent oxidoreductase [Gammaproteobacteria bacterium]|nr:FAD-dependent oxidoreductase [Gammaproteobacteria bacterium]